MPFCAAGASAGADSMVFLCLGHPGYSGIFDIKGMGVSEDLMGNSWNSDKGCGCGVHYAVGTTLHVHYTTPFVQMCLCLVPVQFMRDNDQKPLIMWMDLMKVGRVGKDELNNLCDLLEVGLHGRPTAACAVVIAPYLVSKTVTNGLHGEIRRVEDKLDAKGIMSTAFSIRCAAPPSNKRVPWVFTAWVCLCESGRDENLFKSCQLICDRTGFPIRSQTVHCHSIARTIHYPL